MSVVLFFVPKAQNSSANLQNNSGADIKSGTHSFVSSASSIRAADRQRKRLKT
jgi:hypothetical protein